MFGLFFGLAFVFHFCSYLPLIGLLTALLPNVGTSSPPHPARGERIKLLAAP